MVNYSGIERRRATDDFRDMLIRIDERTENMAETMKTLATKERVEAVEAQAKLAQKTIDEHIKNHGAMSVNRNLIVGSYITALGGLIAAAVAIFHK